MFSSLGTCTQLIKAKLVLDHLTKEHPGVKWVKGQSKHVFNIPDEENNLNQSNNSTIGLSANQTWNLIVDTREGAKIEETYFYHLEKVDGLYYAWMSMLASASECSDLRSEVTLFGNGSRFAFKGAVFPVDTPKEEALEDPGCFQLGERMARATVNLKEERPCLRVHFRVEKIGKKR